MTTLLPLVQSRIKYAEGNFGLMVLFNKTYQNALFQKLLLTMLLKQV